jgi:calcineurin-like phosphoesterase family protein
MKTKNSVWFVSDTHFGQDNTLKFNVGDTDQKIHFLWRAARAGGAS